MYKYGDTIKLKDGVKPQMSLDAETFFSLPDEEEDDVEECNIGNGDKAKTYWGLPEGAFETDDMGFVYLKSEYAKRLVWGVDAVIGVHDDFGGHEYDRLNINVAFDPEGIVCCGAFCSFVNDGDIVTDESNEIKENKKDVGTTFEKKGDKYSRKNRRVVHKEFGPGEIVRIGLFGNQHVVFVRFDTLISDSIPVLKGELEPEVTIVDVGVEGLMSKKKGDSKGRNEDCDAERKLACVEEMGMIHADALAEAKEIEDMDTETLFDEFVLLIRNGAGPNYRRVVFMKKEMLRRISKGDHL